MTRLLLTFAALALIIGGVLHLVHERMAGLNAFVELDEAIPGRCEPVSGVDGPTDLQFDAGGDRVFVASFDRRRDDPDARGSVLAIDVADPLQTSNWRDRTSGAPEAFQPRGLYLWDPRAQAGSEDRKPPLAGGPRAAGKSESDQSASKPILFVANAASRGVERYEVLENGDLRHLETMRDDRLRAPRDVVALGPRSFYVTDSAEEPWQHFSRLRLFSSPKDARIFQFNGVSWRVAAENLEAAAGLALDPVRGRLYVAETGARALRVYDRAYGGEILQERERIFLDAAPIHLNLGTDGHLWVAAAPKPLTLAAHRSNAKTASASAVFRINLAGRNRSAKRLTGEPEKGFAPDAPVFFADGGEVISAASVAARSGRRLLIGALFERKYLLCRLPPV